MRHSATSVRSIFGQVLEIQSPDERAAYLNEACGDNADLRSEVDSLLEAIDQAGNFMKQPMAPSDRTGQHVR